MPKEEREVIKMTVVFNNEHLTEEEATAVEQLLKEMRAEKQKEKMIARHTNIIRYDIRQALTDLGLAETKRIIRALTRSLNDIQVGEE